MLIWVASYPRSGNGYLRTILRDLCGVPTTDVDQSPQLAEAILGGRVREWLPVPTGGTGDAPRPGAYALPPPKPWSLRPLSELVADATIYSLKSHLLASDQMLPAVYLLRDPREVFVSYARFAPLYGESLTEEQFRANLCERIQAVGGPYGSWSEHVAAWLNRPRTVLVRFEDLVQRPLTVLQQVIDGLQLPCQIGAGRLPTFAELQARHPHVYRRGKPGGWRDEFPADLLPLVWEHHGEMMRQLGFTDA